MPVKRGKDKEGCYYRWGNEGYKYHFPCDNEKAKNVAKQNAIIQGIAIGEFQNEYSLGSFNYLRKK